MENSEDGKGITKGAVRDMPKLKDLLRAGSEQSEAGKQPGEEAGFAQPHDGSFEGALEIDQKHGKERSDQGGLGHFGRRRQFGKGFDAKAKSGLLFGELFAQGLFFLLDLFHGEFRGAEAARNVGIEIAAHKTAERDHQHAIEGHTGNVTEFKRGVKGDDNGRSGTKYDVEIEP